jgi:hypothetical protein
VEPIAASTIDHSSRRRLMTFGGAMVAVSVVVMGIAPGYPMLLLGFALYGVGSGPLAHTADVVVVESFPGNGERAYNRSTILDTVGAGKTTIAAECNDVLAERKIPNAAVDLDALAWQYPPTSKWNKDLLFENLASIWPNYAAHGSTRLIVANVFEDDDRDRYAAAIPGASLVICRLVVPEREERVERLRRRMHPGPSLDWHIDRTQELHDILEAKRHEDFIVVNDRPVREVAEEVLTTAGWI